MSSLFNDIGKILSGSNNQRQTESSFLLENWEPRAQLENVHLYEARQLLSKPNPSASNLATAMVELAGTQSVTDVSRDAKEAIVTSAKLFRTNDHLHESWKVMGKLIEAAHNQHKLDLKEMLGSYNDTQLDLLEINLELPWRFTYSEPTPVEVHDYAIPGQDHIFKGTEPEDTTYDEAEDEVEDDETITTESKAQRLKKLLSESKTKRLNEQNRNVKEELVKQIASMLGSGTYKVLSRDRSKGIIEVRKPLPGREYQDLTIEIKEK